MADPNIDQDYQLFQVLQRRHLFENPVELLVKVRHKDGKLREIWVPKSKVVATSVGRSLLRIFNKTKVGERGIDMYIGKRRSLTVGLSQEKMKGSSNNYREMSGNEMNVNCSSIASSHSGSCQELKVNLSQSIPINSDGNRKVKTRSSISRRQAANNSSYRSRVTDKSNKHTGDTKHSMGVALLNKSKKNNSSDQEKKVLAKNAMTVEGSKKPILAKHPCTSKRCHSEPLLEKVDETPHGCKIIKLENPGQAQNSFLGSVVCQSCVSCQTRHDSFHSSPHVLTPQSSFHQCRCHLACSCVECFCSHEDVGGKCCYPQISDVSMETVAMERRVSVRQTESAFRLKEVSVRKFAGFVHLVLGSETTSKKVFKNSFNPRVFQEVCTVLRNITHDDSKVVLLSGSGNIFSSGIDLSYLLESELDRKTAAKNMTEALRDFVDILISFPKPIVAAVNGAATGLGVAILPLCDIVYASDKASFSCPYTSLAQTPEACSSHTFPKTMGLAMANEMLLRGRKITALEAHQTGLITQVFWPENLMAEVIPRVQNLAQQSAKAVECTKALVRSREKAKLELVNQNECRLLNERWSSSECQKAIRVFIDNQNNSL